MHQVTLGGERVGSGNRMKVELQHFERSTHNLSYVWKSTMAAGTFVPFMSELALPGDTFDIDLHCDVLTHPTIGPLFAEYEVNIGVWQTPIRLYQGKLYMNKLNIGLDMSQVKLPQIAMKAEGNITTELPIENQQINSSCIFSYLNMRGLGHNTVSGTPGQVQRYFNAIPYLIYWDVYKNYIANKQEEVGAVIHQPPVLPVPTLTDATLYNEHNVGGIQIEIPGGPQSPVITPMTPITTITIQGTDIDEDTTAQQITLTYTLTGIGTFTPTIDKIFQTIVFTTGSIFCSNPTSAFEGRVIQIDSIQPDNGVLDPDVEPRIKFFPLENIDLMREQILMAASDPGPVLVDENSLEPYNLALKFEEALTPKPVYSKQFSQEGLGLTCYNSDLFNNWIRTEWIDGVDGITEITKIDTTGDSFTLDEFLLGKKVYDMLNAIAVSGGSYDDWQSAVYNQIGPRQATNPMYIGGLMQNLIFQEVVSNSASENQPLGTLAGRGRIGNKRKGGQIVAKIDEPSYLTAYVWLTPKLDYSQGNKWDVNLATMNDLHKPHLDQIGFQDLITDQMAWWDTGLSAAIPNTKTFKSAGKQPAWLNYMTNVNQVRGNFADASQQMFMVLDRRYELGFMPDGDPTIQDLTTYIDPVKFNQIFADTRRDAQNFWVQIAVNIEARRKLSAKIMPNL